MFNPKTPFSAAAIFLAGIGVIACTTLDINRTLQANEHPMSAEQVETLRKMVEHHDQKAADNVLRQLSGNSQR